MKTATEKLKAVNEGAMSPKEFVRQMRQEFPQHITQFNGFDDSVTILKNRGVIVEAKELKSLEDYSEGQTLNFPLEAIERGIRYELNGLGHSTIDNCTEDQYNTCKATVVKNLEKDFNHYLNLLSGESNNVDKHDKETEVKRGEGAVDTFNGLKKADLKENTIKSTMKEGVVNIYNKYGKVPGFGDLLKSFFQMHGKDIDAGADIEDEFTQFIMANSNLDENEEEAEGKYSWEYDDQGYGSVEAFFDDVIHQYGPDLSLDDAKELLGSKGEGGDDTKAFDQAVITQMQATDDDDMDQNSTQNMIQAYKEKYNEPFSTNLIQHLDSLVSEKKINEDVDSFSDVIQVVGVENVEDAVKAIIKYEKEFNNGPVDVKQAQQLVDDLKATDEDEHDKNITNLIVKAFNMIYHDRGVAKVYTENEGKDHDVEILNYIADTYIQNAKDGDKAYAEFRDLNIRDAVQDVVGILQDPKHPLHRETSKEYKIVSRDKARGLFEKKGKDHDGDGDIDGDDYMHAKDKAIKKAMGKKVDEAAKVKKLKKLTVGGKTYEKGDFDPNDDGRIMSIEKYPNGYFITGGVYSDYGDGDEPKEGYGYAIDLKGNEMDEDDLEGMYEGKKINVNEVKTAIKTVITNILKEAHTPTLQSFIDREDTNTELEAAAKDLMNVIEQMESEFLKHRDKIAAAYEKAGAYMAPALEKAFAQDLNSQRVSFEKIELPASPKLTPDQVDQIDQAKAAGDIDEKNTIYTPTK